MYLIHERRIRKMPRPEPRRRFSGASGSGMLSGSSPGPWSAMRMTSASDVVSKEANDVLIGVVGVSVKNGVNGGFAHRHGDMGHGVLVEAGALRACSAVSSTLLTLSRDESSVKLTRLVVESANAVLAEPSARRRRRTKAMMAVCLWMARMSRLTGFIFFSKIHLPSICTDELTIVASVRNPALQVSYHAGKRNIRMQDNINLLPEHKFTGCRFPVSRLPLTSAWTDA